MSAAGRPLVVHEPEVTRGLAARLRLTRLLTRHLGAPGLGALHVPQRLRDHRAARRPSRWCPGRRSSFRRSGRPRSCSSSRRAHPRRRRGTPSSVTRIGIALRLRRAAGCSAWSTRRPAMVTGVVGGPGRRRGPLARVHRRPDDSAEGRAPAGRRHHADHLARHRDAARFTCSSSRSPSPCSRFRRLRSTGSPESTTRCGRSEKTRCRQLPPDYRLRLGEVSLSDSPLSRAATRGAASDDSVTDQRSSSRRRS